jgi:flap endonuclease-1
MGVNISDIVLSKKKSLKDFKGKIVAIDAYNTLYQFLSIIRQPDGTPLKDSKDRVTSHLTGLLYRNANLLEVGIKPIFVFDGKPHELKKRTIEGRRFIREKARKEWKLALKEGDMERARSKAQQSSRLTPEMVSDSKTLLSHLGIPHVQAKGEGEAQASYMALKGDVWAAGSQDFDSLLCGAPLLIRNITITGRRKLPRKNVYIRIEPEIIALEENLNSLSITREQLVDIGILVGTDFNEGIKGVGPKTALKLIKKHKTLEEVIKIKGWRIADYREIRSIFLEPDNVDDYDLSWKAVNAQEVKRFLCDEHDFSEDRVEKAIKKMSEAKKADEQKSLDGWF